MLNPTKFAKATRQVLPKHRMDTVAHWIAAFCLGFLLSEIGHTVSENNCSPVKVECIAPYVSASY